MSIPVENSVALTKIAYSKSHYCEKIRVNRNLSCSDIFYWAWHSRTYMSDWSFGIGEHRPKSESFFLVSTWNIPAYIYPLKAKV